MQLDPAVAAAQSPDLQSVLAAQVCCSQRRVVPLQDSVMVVQSVFWVATVHSP